MNRSRWLALGAVAVTLSFSAEFHVPTRPERLAALGSTDRLDPALKRALLVESAFQPIPAPGPGDWLSSHPEPGQTYDLYVTAFPNRPDSSRGVLYVEAIGSMAGKGGPSVAFLKRFAGAFFGLPVKELPAMDLRGLGVTERINAYTGKRQLLTRDLKGLLRQRLPSDAYCIIGMTMEDLYPGPGWNFVFGESSFTERTAVYSFARYDPAFYGPVGKDAGRTILLRSCRVMVHEVGHMFGMGHCVYYACLMNGSNSMEESDSQPLHLCPVCLRKLQWNVGFDVVGRYRRMQALCAEAGFADEARWYAEEIVRLQPPGVSR